MEKVLNSKKFSNNDATKALNEENQRLRNEMQQKQVRSVTVSGVQRKPDIGFSEQSLYIRLQNVDKTKL